MRRRKTLMTDDPAHEYTVPGGAAAALSTMRPEMARIVATQLREGILQPLSPEEQAGLLDLVADLIQRVSDDQDQLRDSLLTVRGIREYGKGLQGMSEKIIAALAACNVG
jgi:hypothetical protein